MGPTTGLLIATKKELISSFRPKQSVENQEPLGFAGLERALPGLHMNELDIFGNVCVMFLQQSFSVYRAHHTV